MSYSNGIGHIASSLLQQSSEVQKPEIRAAAAAGGPNIAAGSSIDSNDQTSLSPASRLLSQALQVSDVRSEKVTSLQQAIASGTYNVASSAVADKLLQSLIK